MSYSCRILRLESWLLAFRKPTDILTEAMTVRLASTRCGAILRDCRSQSRRFLKEVNQYLLMFFLSHFVGISMVLGVLKWLTGGRRPLPHALHPVRTLRSAADMDPPPPNIPPPLPPLPPPSSWLVPSHQHDSHLQKDKCSEELTNM